MTSLSFPKSLSKRKIKMAKEGPGPGMRKSHEAQVIPAKDDLVCSVCLDHLNDPKLLPCLHSFCKRCVDHFSGTRCSSRGGGDAKMVKVACPRCRSIHRVPKDGFPSDLVASNALAFHQDFQKPRTESAEPVVCNACTEGDLATGHCPTCNKFLCEFCSKAHKRLVEFRTHKLVPLDEVNVEALKALGCSRYCSQHQGEVLKLYCNTCHCLICRDCTIVDHRDHAFGFTAILRPEVQQEIQQMATAMAAKQKEFEAHLAFIRAAEKGRGEHSVELTKEINAAFDLVIKAVEQQRQKLLQQEQGSKTADLKQIWGQKEFIEVTLASIASGMCYIDHLCNCTNDQDMLAISHKVKQQLSTVLGRTWDPEVGFLSSTLLTFTLGTNEQHLSKRVGKLRTLLSSEVTVSVRPIGLRGSGSQYNLQLRNTLRFSVEIKCKSYDRLNTVVLPSVSVKNAKTNQDIKYAHTLVFEQKTNSWTLNVVPTYAGFFNVSVSVEVREEGGDHPTHYPAMFSYSVSPHHTNHILSVHVTGVPKPGDKVRRGPGWCRGSNEDGGVGSEGIVTKVDQREMSGYDSGGRGNNDAHTHAVSVRWGNGKCVQYSWDEQTHLFPIELFLIISLLYARSEDFTENS